MVKRVIVLAFIFLPFLCESQALPHRLTLRQIITLFKLDQSEVNDYLISRNWDFEEAEKQAENKNGHVSWAFRKDKHNAIGQGFFNIYFYKGSNVTARYQCSQSSIYNALKSEAISFKMQKKKSGIYNDGAIYTDYVGENYAIRFETGKDALGNLLFAVDLYNKSYYYNTRFND